MRIAATVLAGALGIGFAGRVWAFVVVEEVPSGSAPIEGVGTAIAGFIGMAPQGPVNAPTMVTNWRQYVALFGDITSGAYLGHRRSGSTRTRRGRGRRRT